ncbi:GH12 family glycosyl hydrolase domain-containing protein [Streptomyces viridochromogenes]|uniref:Putative secreted endo-1,4-beta-glucanase n=1 Tax=Streptomyces viridochromogenes Tue57 TaxID=1160705 RepID=L8PLL6_STRVR|nr:putative secreted endo-1,4-beta-glucanase [Streptomyces viridochromogenes]ELS56888.1 putative secreted endo-1,4-beta-glucanase [Streptomyces viridochromogenes Tue57]
MNNNLWNEGKVTGTQCVRDNSRSGSTISWGDALQPGRQRHRQGPRREDVRLHRPRPHWGFKVDKAQTGLPIRVGDRKPVRTSWEFSVSSHPGTRNVAYDLWLHAKNTADRQDRPSDEIMIWLNRQGGAGPLGTKYGSVSLGGAMGDIYEGDIGWKVHPFVRRSNTSRATLDLDDFTRALVRRNLLGNDTYVSGIEAGTEVFKGTGRLDTKAYSADIG